MIGKSGVLIASALMAATGAWAADPPGGKYTDLKQGYAWTPEDAGWNEVEQIGAGALCQRPPHPARHLSHVVLPVLPE